jgi:hypothetical protein
VRAAFLTQPIGSAFQHQAHGCRHGPQLRHLFAAHAASVDMRQQAGAIANLGCDVRQVLQGGFKPVGGQPHASSAIPKFRTLTKREQSLFASQRRSARRYGDGLAD